jgi:hypothetical protein
MTPECVVITVVLQMVMLDAVVVVERAQLALTVLAQVAQEVLVKLLI